MTDWVAEGTSITPSLMYHTEPIAEPAGYRKSHVEIIDGFHVSHCRRDRNSIYSFSRYAG